MKILQLISSSGFFGAENVLVQLADALQKDGSCQVVGGVIKNIETPHLEVATECGKRGIESVVFPCTGKLDLKTILLLKNYLKEHKIDIIHSHGYKSNLYSFFATILSPVKLIATCHNWLGDESKMKFYASLDRFFLRRFSAVVAVSLPVKETLLRNGISANRTRIIGNGIDLGRFETQTISSDVKQQFGIPESHVVIGTVGRISSEKGQIHLLKTIGRIQQQFPETTLLLVGDGDLRNNLEKEFGGANVIFTGIRNDLPALYHCMDIFVLPSLTEGLPMVLLEAMASSLPVVATRVGDVPRVMVEDETGYIEEAGDEEGLEKSLMILLSDPVKRKTMGKKGYQRVIEGFSSSQMAHEYFKIYCDVLGQNP